MTTDNTYCEFTITKETPIILYGAAAHGLRGYHSLKANNGYNVIGFFDKRADEIPEQFGLPVWKMTDPLPVNRDGVLVVICLKNVFEHIKVAARLIRHGFRFFIFKVLADNAAGIAVCTDAINRNYDRIFNDSDINSQYTLEPVPALYGVSEYSFRDYAAASETDGRVTVSLPLSSIFVKTSEEFGLMRDGNDLASVMALTPHIGFFRLLDGEGGEPDEFVSFCIKGAGSMGSLYGEGGGKIVVTDAWRDNVIQNRSMVFNRMNTDMELDPGFSYGSAPNVVLNDDGRLVMLSAKHRAAFYLAKGKCFMPVSMEKDQYRRLVNMGAASGLLAYLTEKGISELDAPVMHPYMYKYPCVMGNYYSLFVQRAVYHMSRIFAGLDIESITVEDSLRDNGAFARCLARIGFPVRKIAGGAAQKELCGLLDRLFGVGNIDYAETNGPADVICVSYMKMEISIKAKILIFMGKAKDYAPPEGFEDSIKLFETIWGGEKFVGYISVRDNGVSS